MRRAILAALLLLTPAAARAWPDRQITMIHPYATGSASDATARVLAEVFAQRLGQNVVVVNRDGGSGTVGMLALAASPADGHTIAYTAITPLAVQPHLVRNLALGPDSVAPVCNVAENVLGIVVRADSPWKDVPALVAAARQQPLSFGSPGPNSVPQVGVLRIQAVAGGDYVHVPFRGDAPSLTELLAGRLDFSAAVVASAGPHIRAGRLRLIGVFSARRHPEFPDVPTMQEQGIAAVQPSYASVYAPRGTPAEVLDRMEAACRAAVESESFRPLVANFGVVPDFRGRAEMTRLLKEQYEAFGQAFRELGVRPE